MMRLILTAVLRGQTLLFPKLLLASLCLLPAAAWSQASAISATINVAKTGAPISKNIYGQFLEHGGDILNGGIWSEMLVDRKFFYPVTTVAPTPPAAMGNAAGDPRFENLPKRWWAPVGGDSIVTIDSKACYTGDQSPAVRLSMAEPHGLRQSGILVRKKKTYTGRFLLAGTPGTLVRVALIVDSGATGHQAITIHALAPTGKLRRMVPNSIDATVKASSPAELQVEEQSLGALPATVTLRPYSVNIYSYPIQ